MTEKQTSEVLLEKHKNSEATGITIPFDVEQVFGAKRVPVKVFINGADYRSTIFRRKGEYLLVIPKMFRDAAGVKAGETINVELEKDLEPRVIEAPPDLRKSLDKNKDAEEIWEKQSYTHKREFVMAIEDAKREETRARRIQKTVDELLKKKK